MQELDLPPRLDPSEAFRFLQRLKGAPDDDHYVLNFGNVTFAEPFAMLILASEIRTFREAHAAARFRATNFEHLTYLAHVGFFTAFGLKFGKDPGEAAGSANYLPLTFFPVDEVRSEARQSMQDVGAAVEAKSEQLARLLLREKTGLLVDVVTYSLREIVRNVIEHSSSPTLGYCGQYWPAVGNVEIAIADAGVGLASTLRRNPHVQVKSDRHAIHLAMMPGISGRAYKGAPKQRSVWANSGYGLYMTSRLCGDGGEFTICSNTAAVTVCHNGITDYDILFHGTAVRMMINLKKVGGLRDALTRYRREAAEQSREKRGTPVTASTASQMLRRDFPED